MHRRRPNAFVRNPERDDEVCSAESALGGYRKKRKSRRTRKRPGRVNFFTRFRDRSKLGRRIEGSGEREKKRGNKISLYIRAASGSARVLLLCTRAAIKIITAANREIISYRKQKVRRGFNPDRVKRQKSAATPVAAAAATTTGPERGGRGFVL